MKLKFPSLRFGSVLISLADARRMREVVNAYGFGPVSIETNDGLTEANMLAQQIDDAPEPQHLLFSSEDVVDQFNVAMLAKPFKFDSVANGLSALLGAFRPGLSLIQYVSTMPEVQAAITAAIESKVAKLIKI